MQILWMVLVTLGLALTGVLGLAVLSYAAARKAPPTSRQAVNHAAPRDDARREGNVHDH